MDAGPLRRRVLLVAGLGACLWSSSAVTNRLDAHRKVLVGRRPEEVRGTGYARG
jgi:hypothetical protein